MWEKLRRVVDNDWIKKDIHLIFLTAFVSFFYGCGQESDPPQYPGGWAANHWCPILPATAISDPRAFLEDEKDAFDFWLNARWGSKGGKIFSPILYKMCKIALVRALCERESRDVFLGENGGKAIKVINGPVYTDFLKERLLPSGSDMGNRRIGKAREGQVEEEKVKAGNKKGKKTFEMMAEEPIVVKNPSVRYSLKMEVDPVFYSSFSREKLKKFILSAGIEVSKSPRKILPGYEHNFSDEKKPLIKVVGSMGFSGNWCHFKKRDTRNGPFFGIAKNGLEKTFKVPFMVASNGIPCMDLAALFLAKFDFSGEEGVASLVVLTYKGISDAVNAAKNGWQELLGQGEASKILRGLKEENTDHWMNVEVWLPRFKEKGRAFVKRVFLELPGKDVGPIDIVSDSEIQVDEDGVCLRSKMEWSLRGKRRVNWVFKFDRPFLFFIQYRGDLIAVGECKGF